MKTRRLELQRFLQLLLPQEKVLLNSLIRSFLGLNRPEHFVEAERAIQYRQVDSKEEEEDANNAPPPRPTTFIPCAGRDPQCSVM